MSFKQKIAIGSVIAFLCFLLLMIFFGDNGFFDVLRLKEEKAVLAEKSRRTEAENVELYRTINRLKHDPKYIESIARKELGMVGQNEVIFKFKEERSENE
ncbi:MAG: FtsB family cell division protein [Thermodesulfobacteriota bacterium]